MEDFSKRKITGYSYKPGDLYVSINVGSDRRHVPLRTLPSLSAYLRSTNQRGNEVAFMNARLITEIYHGYFIAKVYNVPIRVKVKPNELCDRE